MITVTCPEANLRNTKAYVTKQDMKKYIAADIRSIFNGSKEIEAKR
jgi:hypothetical protein